MPSKAKTAALQARKRKYRTERRQNKGLIRQVEAQIHTPKPEPRKTGDQLEG